MVLSLSLNLMFFNIKKNLFDIIFFKKEIWKGITFSLNCTNFQINSPKETQDIYVHFVAFMHLRMWLFYSYFLIFRQISNQLDRAWSSNYREPP